VEIKIACTGDVAEMVRALQERFQGAIKMTPTITPASPEEIEQLQLPDGSRKRRQFVDLREG